MTSDVRTIIALCQLPRMSGGSVRQLLASSQTQGSSIASLSEAVELLSPRRYSDDELGIALARADRILADCTRLGAVILTFGSPSYPAQLQRLAHAPTMLFVRGQFDGQTAPRIAVIGTRTPTAWGRRTAKTCAEQIVRTGGVVVSGLAPGIDTAAHAATVEAGGITWAVLASGLDAISTSSQRSLATRILDSGGALMSEYPPTTPAQRQYFVARDRIQAGLSDAVLMIESELGGGAMHTVRFAQRATVPVWVTFPGETKSPHSVKAPTVQRGPWELLRQGAATRVSSAAALADMVCALAPTSSPPTR
jgi:DNA processing protein